MSGSPINPYSRIYPEEMIQTGISTIDTMVRTRLSVLGPSLTTRTLSLEDKRSLSSVPPVYHTTISLPRFVDKPVWSTDQEPPNPSTMVTRTISPSSSPLWVLTWKPPGSSSRTLRRVELFPTVLFSSIWLLTLRTSLPLPKDQG